MGTIGALATLHRATTTRKDTLSQCIISTQLPRPATTVSLPLTGIKVRPANTMVPITARVHAAGPSSKLPATTHRRTSAVLTIPKPTQVVCLWLAIHTSHTLIITSSRPPTKNALLKASNQCNPPLEVGNLGSLR
jgi:hypothetical protein